MKGNLCTAPQAEKIIAGGDADGSTENLRMNIFYVDSRGLMHELSGQAINVQMCKNVRKWRELRGVP
jgi:hypothetical protein